MENEDIVDYNEFTEDNGKGAEESWIYKMHI